MAPESHKWWEFKPPLLPTSEAGWQSLTNDWQVWGHWDYSSLASKGDSLASFPSPSVFHAPGPMFLGQWNAPIKSLSHRSSSQAPLLENTAQGKLNAGFESKPIGLQHFPHYVVPEMLLQSLWACSSRISLPFKKLNGHCGFRCLEDKHDISKALCLLISSYYNYMSLKQKTFECLSKMKWGTQRKKLLIWTSPCNFPISGSIIS